MSEVINDGGPAFPFVEPAGPGVSVAPGMSLRDHFAGLALNGLLANPGGPIQDNSRSGWGLVNCRAKDIADLSYEMADEMIKARGRP